MLKFGILGCGDISHTHAKAMESVDGARFVACCDVVLGKAKSWAEQYGCSRFYDSFDAMLSSESLDAIILATWPKQHLSQIKSAVEHGIKNILCEKSLTLNLAEALEVLDICNKHEVFLLEACKYRYHPVFRKMASLVSDGSLGAIDSIHATFSNYEPTPGIEYPEDNWRYKKACGGGVTHDWLSYLVNASNYFSEASPCKVFASGTVNEKFGVATRLFGQIEYPNGMVASVACSKHGNFFQGLELVCEFGRVYSPITWGVFGNCSLELSTRIQDFPYTERQHISIRHEDSFVLQLENFINSMLGKEQPEIPLSESVANIATIEALEHSLTIGQSVDVVTTPSDVHHELG
jgi:predicted dehydrogenase